MSDLESLSNALEAIIRFQSRSGPPPLSERTYDCVAFDVHSVLGVAQRHFCMGRSGSSFAVPCRIWTFTKAKQG